MRQVIFLVAALSLAGCASHSAYGPESDERIDDGVSASSSQNSSADASMLMSLSCQDQAKALTAASLEADEAKKLKMLGDTYLKAKENFTKLDEAASSQTDLLYGKEGDQIKANLDGCRDTSAAAYSAFDRFIREIVDMPVVQEMKNRKMVNVARVNFAIVRDAIAKLDASDKEVLTGKLAAIEPTLDSGKDAAK